MRHARLLLLLPAVFALGCPGDWDEPLGPVREGHVDSRLVGRWLCRADDDPTTFILSIIPFDKDQYVLALTDPVDARKEIGFLRGFTTTVNGHDVMNLKDLDETPADGKWSYARFDVLPDGALGVRLLDGTPLDSVPDDVESRALAIGDLFETEELWIRGPRCARVKEEPDRP
jgi:hypothetical protein